MSSELILLIVSGILLAIGAYRWQRASHLIRHGKKTTVIVLDNKSDSSGRQTYYFPIVELNPDDSKRVAHTLNIGYESPLPHGTKIDIIYDPDDPSIVEIDSGKQLEIIPRVFVVAGLCGLVLVLFEVFELTHLLPQ